jgi:hypothetical protein
MILGKNEDLILLCLLLESCSCDGVLSFKITYKIESTHALCQHILYVQTIIIHLQYNCNEWACMILDHYKTIKGWIFNFEFNFKARDLDYNIKK